MTKREESAPKQQIIEIMKNSLNLVAQAIEAVEGVGLCDPERKKTILELLLKEHEEQTEALAEAERRQRVQDCSHQSVKWLCDTCVQHETKFGFRSTGHCVIVSCKCGARWNAACPLSEAMNALHAASEGRAMMEFYQRLLASSCDHQIQESVQRKRGSCIFTLQRTCTKCGLAASTNPELWLVDGKNVSRLPLVQEI